MGILSVQDFLDGISASIEATQVPNEGVGVKQEASPGELVIGTMSEQLRKLYVQWQLYKAVLGEECAKHQQLHQKTKQGGKLEPEELTLVQEHVSKHWHEEFLHALFKRMVILEFPQVSLFEEGIGVRKGWIIVRRCNRGLCDGCAMYGGCKPEI